MINSYDKYKIKKINVNIKFKLKAHVCSFILIVSIKYIL